jgi:hypothetical protein
LSVDTAASSSSSASAATTINGAVAAGSNGSSSMSSGFDRQAIHLAIEEEMHTAFEAEMGAMNKVSGGDFQPPSGCWRLLRGGAVRLILKQTCCLPSRLGQPGIMTLTLSLCRAAGGAQRL